MDWDRDISNKLKSGHSMDRTEQDYRIRLPLPFFIEKYFIVYVLYTIPAF